MCSPQLPFYNTVGPTYKNRTLPRGPERSWYQALQLTNPEAPQQQWRAEVSIQGSLGPFKQGSCSCQEHWGKCVRGWPKKFNMFWWLSKHPSLLILPTEVSSVNCHLSCFVFQSIQFKDNPLQTCTVVFCVKSSLLEHKHPHHQSICCKRPCQLRSSHSTNKWRANAPSGLPAPRESSRAAVLSSMHSELSHNPNTSESSCYCEEGENVKKEIKTNGKRKQWNSFCDTHNKKGLEKPDGGGARL